MRDETRLTVRRIFSTDELTDVFRLRYQVYCLERDYESPEDYPCELESDEYDQYSMHFIARAEDIPVGTVRLILPSPLNLPVARYCGVKLDEICPDSARVAEISRLAVSSLALKQCSISKGYVTVRLIRELFRANKLFNLDINYVFVAMSKALERRLQRCGIGFTKAGNPVEYHGIRTPYYAATDELVQRLSQNRAGIYDRLFASQFAVS